MRELESSVTYLTKIIFVVNLMTQQARYVEFSVMQDVESKQV